MYLYSFYNHSKLLWVHARIGAHCMASGLVLSLYSCKTSCSLYNLEMCKKMSLRVSINSTLELKSNYCRFAWSARTHFHQASAETLNTLIRTQMI